MRIAAARVLKLKRKSGSHAPANFRPRALARTFTISKPEGFERLSRLPGQRRRTGSIGDLESGLLGEVSQTNRGGSSSATRDRMGQRAVISSPQIANVATAYFRLRALDTELENRSTRWHPGTVPQPTQGRQKATAPNSRLDVSQAEQLVYTASETIPDLERQIQQQENVLSVLLGEIPAIHSPRTCAYRTTRSPERSGRPAFELLERRPDVRQRKR